jgi:hypothetical protein
VRRSILVWVLAVTALAGAAGILAPVAGAAVSPARGGGGGEGGGSGDLGSIGVRLLDVAADLADDPRSRQYVTDDLKPGSVIHRRIQVANKSSSPVSVLVYADAASIANGSFVGARDATANDLTTWTTLDHSALDIPAGATADDTVTIAVPADAAPGERYGVVWAQIGGTQGSGGVALINRTGIRLYVSVSGDNPPAAAFTIDALTAERDPDDRPVLLAQVHNTGGRAVDLSGTLNLSEVSGNINAGPYLVRLGTSLAPGQSEPVTIPVTDQLTDGPWNAVIHLKSGLLEESAQARITFPDTPGIAPAASATPVAGRPHPILIGTLIGVPLLLAGSLVAFVIRRRRMV